jgi:hypothetical protein
MSAPISDRHRQLMTNIKNSGAIDFTKLGDVVTQVTPQLFDGDIAADDYIAKGYSSVVQIWKVGVPSDGLDQVAQLQNIAARVQTAGVNE